MNTQCNLCPRKCNVDRSEKRGYCSMPDKIYISRAALHFWEEPCISGKSGSGTVFFSGCPLKCIYCQNRDISLKNFGKEITEERLGKIFIELQKKGANNINLVTPTHYADKIVKCVKKARLDGLNIPVIYNTSGYECPETLDILQDTVDIFMPDFKYFDEKTAKEYSNAPDYPETVKKAIDKMVEIQPEIIFDENGIMKKGVIIRHLLLPGHVKEAKTISEYILKRYGNKIILSLMSQYTPMENFEKYPCLSRKVKKKEYESLLDYICTLDYDNIYIQEGHCAQKSFIPPFTLEGI